MDIVFGGLFRMKSNLYIKKDIDIKDGLVSLEYTDQFWYLLESLGNNDYQVVCQESKREYASLEALEKDFISLENFLKQAKPIGHQFLRTKAIIDSDGEIDRKYTYLNGYNEYIALYAYEGIVLAYQVNPYFDGYNFYDNTSYHQYTIIPAFYVKDGNYSLSGETSYLEKDTTYDEVIKQERPRARRRLVLKQD